MARRISNSQVLVLAFFVAVTAALVAILAYAPSVYAGTVIAASGAVEIGFLSALVLFLGFLSVGVVRRWRWVFWLIVVAFLAGFLRVPVAALELGGVIGHSEPDWYVLLQGVIGAVQLGIGIALLAGYRRGGVWGAF